MPFRSTPENIQTRQLNKIRFSVPESMSLDFAFEPINFVVSGTGVSKKFILKKNSKKSHFVLVVMCSFS